MFLLLVNTFELTSHDVRLNYQLPKRGDVVAVRKHYESFGLSEVLDPQWRIILVPDITEIQAHGLLVTEKAPPYTPTAPVRYRAFNLDTDKIPGFDRPRTASFEHDQSVRPDLILTVNLITLITVSKTFFDVTGLGPDPNVIG